MDFLYRQREAGKRTVKPSKDSEHLEALLGEESDDSDFEVDKHKDDGSDVSGAESSDSDASEADEDEEDEGSSGSGDEDDLLELRKNLSTQEILNIAQRQRSHAGPSTGNSRDKQQLRVCGACLGSRSDDTDEIVICDSCGISVHEVCYGVQESGSIASNLSDASTEPWFCEPCRANVRDPACQVCPNVGGIYKETDVGTWIHLVCALYTPNISFFDPQRITRATLFELNYQNWGRRACTLCKEEKFARTGICIECDAGLCRSFFHVTCAQEHGLLSEPKEDDHESYFGHCRMHSDKETVRRRKLSWITNLLQHRERSTKIQTEFDTADADSSSSKSESSVKRILRKLRHQQHRWSSSKQRPAWIPTQKMPRSLLTNSSAVKRLLSKFELQGWNEAAMEEAERNREILADINKRWNVNPALNVEFVAYYHDRTNRILSMQESLASSVLANNELTDTQTVIREQYSKLVQEEEEETKRKAEINETYSKYQELLTRLDNLKRTVPDLNGHAPDLNGPAPAPKKGGRTTPGGRRSSTGKKPSKAAAKQHSVISSPEPTPCLSSCRLCDKKSDQHLLAHCDVCRYYYHLGCLSPPLEKMPKKTKQYGWQCSECDKDPSEPFQYNQTVLDPEAPRASRKRRSTFLNTLDLDISASISSVLNSFTTPSPTPSPTTSSKGTTASSTSTKGTAAKNTRKRKSTEALEREVLAKKPTVCLPRIKKSNLSETMDSDKKKSRLSAPEELNTSMESTAQESPLLTPVFNEEEPKTEPEERSRRSRRNETAVREEVPCKVSEPQDSVLDPRDSPMNTTVEVTKEPIVNGLLTPKLPPKKLFKSKATLKELPADLEEKTNFQDWLGKKLSPSGRETCVSKANGFKDLSDEVSSDVNAEINPNIITVRLQDSPGSDKYKSEDSEAKKERKRQKKEEKEKRREEKRKMKALMSVNIVSDPDIEENDDTCVVRIAPKPIKIKIKPLIPPPGVTNPSPTPSNPSPAFSNMHPKKKMVQMDSLSHQGSIANNDSIVTESSVASSINQSNETLSSPKPTPADVDSESSTVQLTGDIDKTPLKVDTTPARTNHVGRTNSTAASAESVEVTTTPALTNGGGGTRERRSRSLATSSVKKGGRGGDARTKCDVCSGEGTNANLVRCDECAKCYHFGCLNPPVKKTPKVPGWSWACSDCAPSDEDKSWHL